MPSHPCPATAATHATKGESRCFTPRRTPTSSSRVGTCSRREGGDADKSTLPRQAGPSAYPHSIPPSGTTRRVWHEPPAGADSTLGSSSAYRSKFTFIAVPRIPLYLGVGRHRGCAPRSVQQPEK